MSLAHELPSILQLGKSSLTPEFTQSVWEAFQTRELMKISVLNNCSDDPRTLAETLAGRTKSQVVQVIGKKIVLYKQNRDNPQIVLPR
jgi:RNA-binding protein